MGSIFGEGPITKKLLLFILASGIASSALNICLYAAPTFIPTASTASNFRASGLFFCFLVGRCCFDEKLTPVKLVSGALAVIGCLIISIGLLIPHIAENSVNLNQTLNGINKFQNITNYLYSDHNIKSTKNNTKQTRETNRRLMITFENQSVSKHNITLLDTQIFKFEPQVVTRDWRNDTQNSSEFHIAKMDTTGSENYELLLAKETKWSLALGLMLSIAAGLFVSQVRGITKYLSNQNMKFTQITLTSTFIQLLSSLILAFCFETWIWPADFEHWVYLTGHAFFSGVGTTANFACFSYGEVSYCFLMSIAN